LEVKLPEAQVRPVTSQDNPFIISITEDGEIFIGETEFSPEEFDDLFPEFFEIASPTMVYIRADAEARHGDVFRVKGTVFPLARDAGASVAELGEPLPPSR
jgi:biopolymer transport protein TolR